MGRLAGPAGSNRHPVSRRLGHGTPHRPCSRSGPSDAVPSGLRQRKLWRSVPRWGRTGLGSSHDLAVTMKDAISSGRVPRVSRRRGRVTLVPRPLGRATVPLTAVATAGLVANRSAAQLPTAALPAGGSGRWARRRRRQGGPPTQASVDLIEALPRSGVRRQDALAHAVAVPPLRAGTQAGTCRSPADRSRGTCFPVDRIEPDCWPKVGRLPDGSEANLRPVLLAQDDRFRDDPIRGV